MTFRAVQAAWKSAWPDNVLLKLAQALARHLAGNAVPMLAHAARTAIDQRTNYRLAARLLVELRNLHNELGLDFTPGFEHFKTSYGHRKELLKALRQAGL